MNVVRFMVLSQHSPGGTGENEEKLKIIGAPAETLSTSGTQVGHVAVSAP